MNFDATAVSVYQWSLPLVIQVLWCFASVIELDTAKTSSNGSNYIIRTLPATIKAKLAGRTRWITNIFLKENDSIEK